jgi:hypothetical protein
MRTKLLEEFLERFVIQFLRGFLELGCEVPDSSPFGNKALAYYKHSGSIPEGEKLVARAVQVCPKEESLRFSQKRRW